VSRVSGVTLGDTWTALLTGLQNLAKESLKNRIAATEWVKTAYIAIESQEGRVFYNAALSQTELAACFCY